MPPYLNLAGKGPHSGPKYGVMNGGFPLIYDSFMGQNFHWGSKGGSAPLFTGQNMGPKLPLGV
jgi:hypothetical protein